MKFPTARPGERVILALRPEVPLGMSAQEAGKGHEKPSHPQNSNRYFTNREEAQQLVEVLKRQLAEVGISPVYGTGLTCVTALGFYPAQSPHTSPLAVRVKTTC